MEHVGAVRGGRCVLQDVNLTFRQGEQWALVGASGSGKTTLAEILSGRLHFTGAISSSFGPVETFYHSVVLVEQQHRFKDLTNRNDFYYQQRYNSFDCELTGTVQEFLSPLMDRRQQENQGIKAAAIIDLLGIDQLMQEPLIQLSNGENKRIQLVRALLQNPKLLILDQPFVGLDSGGRAIVHRCLEQLCLMGIMLIVICPPFEIPSCTTHIGIMDKGRVVVQSADAFTPGDFSIGDLLHDASRLPTPAVQVSPAPFSVAVQMTNVNVQYGQKQILKNIDWKILKGEKWSLTGPNGAGKSTLLSLITGDNPQAYANEIYLFDRRRGTGESIWDIKSRIGYISPELHLYFDHSATCFETVASGLFDTVGLFRQLSLDQKGLVENWLDYFGLVQKGTTLLSRLSLGEQRLILLARALIKNPSLLILDEPCQGLDDQQTRSMKDLVGAVCERYDSTLIYVSHYQEEIPACVDHGLHLNKGQIV